MSKINFQTDSKSVGSCTCAHVFSVQKRFGGESHFIHTVQKRNKNISREDHNQGLQYPSGNKRENRKHETTGRNLVPKINFKTDSKPIRSHTITQCPETILWHVIFYIHKKTVKISPGSTTSKDHSIAPAPRERTENIKSHNEITSRWPIKRRTQSFPVSGQ